MGQITNSNYIYLFLNLVLAGTFFYLDLLLPLGFAGGIFYISLILFGFLRESRNLIIGNAVIGTGLTVLGAWFSPLVSDLTIAIFNRILAVCALWLTAYCCLVNLKLTQEKLRSDLLEQANSALKKETGYVQLNRDIALFTNLSRSLEDTISYSLSKICEFTGWPVGHLYLLEDDGQTLMPSGIWYLEDGRQFNNFKEITRQSQLGRGEGLPGRVIAQGKAHFILDLKADSNFPRATLSDDLGIVSGFGFPILVEDTAVGVMEFYSSLPMEPEERLKEIMENIGVLLGRVIERTRSDLEKKNFNNHLRRLYHKLDSIREEESKRIAREIHDNLGQVLTTLKIELSLLDNKLMKKNNDVADSMSMMFSLLEKNMEVVRDISRELRPPVLDYMNLTKAIEWQGELFQEKTGVKFSLHTVPSKIDLDEHRSTTLFRIFQECLTNITRHSKASEVCVQIFLRDGNLMMQVIDNGIGITDEEVNSTRSLGILGMKERAQVWSGEVDLAGGKGEGTTVTIQIKCDSNV